jgi:hypothetical protein
MLVDDAARVGDLEEGLAPLFGFDPSGDLDSLIEESGVLRIDVLDDEHDQ